MQALYSLHCRLLFRFTNTIQTRSLGVTSVTKVEVPGRQWDSLAPVCKWSDWAFVFMYCIACGTAAESPVVEPPLLMYNVFCRVDTVV